MKAPQRLPTSISAIHIQRIEQDVCFARHEKGFGEIPLKINLLKVVYMRRVHPIYISKTNVNREALKTHCNRRFLTRGGEYSF